MYYNKIDGGAMKFYIESKIIVDPGLETDGPNQGTNVTFKLKSMINTLPSMIL